MNGVVAHRFYSVEEAASAAAVLPGKGASARNLGEHNEFFTGRSRGGGSHAKWWGLPNGEHKDFAQLREFWSTGWPEGVAQLREKMGRVTIPNVTSVRRRPRWADAGDELNRERLYAGDLDRAWRTTSRTVVSAPRVIRVIVDIAANAGTTAEALFWRGAAGAALTEALTAAGYSVELLAGIFVRGVFKDGRDYISATTIKAASAPLNMGAVAATCCSASFFRSTFFMLAENAGRGDTWSGHGQVREGLSSDVGAKYLAEIGIAKTATTRTFVVTADALTPEGATQWVADVVAALEKETQFA